MHLLSIWDPLRWIETNIIRLYKCDSVYSLDKSSCPSCDTWTLSAKANPDKSLSISGQDPKKDKRTCLLCTNAWLTLILCYFWDILDRYFGCLKQSLDKQTIRARLTWPCVPSAPLTVRLTINPQNESKGMMADMFIGCICCLQIPGPSAINANASQKQRWVATSCFSWGASSSWLARTDKIKWCLAGRVHATSCPPRGSGWHIW